MWLINCLLLIVGTTAGICGLSFYVRNKEAAGRMRIYIFSYGVCAAIWCLFFGLIGFCDDPAVCNIFRKAGDIGIISFMITETFLAMDITGADKRVGAFFKTFSVVLGAVDYLAFSQENVNTFVRVGNWTTWIANPEGAVNRAVHTAYIALTFIVLFTSAIVWYRNNKVKRMRRFIFLVFVSNFTMLFFTLPDTFLPAMGKPAVSTSGIGAALCAIVMWYGATELGSFDIRMGNLRDKLFDLIEAGVVVLDTEKRIALMNRYAAKRVQAAGTRGNAIGDFIDISEEDAQALLDSSVNEIVTARLRNTQKNRIYSVRLSAVKDSYNEVFCFICVLLDVTEEMEAVRKFEVASHAKSRFLAQMSHEIRTPINAILGMNEMILRESKDREILDYAGNIDSAGNTLLSLINSILDFSKIEDGKMEIIPVKYGTASFINDLYHSIIQRADAKGLSFVLDVDETLPSVLIGDDVRVFQVIMNLLTNAVKYTEKGSVTLTIRAAEKTKDTVKIAVSVKDTGIGIREEDRERLFESFERLDEVRNHNIEGTGLGLSIVTSLLNMMGSHLEVESAYGVGSVFSFTITQEIADDTPIGDYQKKLKESRIRRGNEELIHAPGAKILVVDDSEMNLKVAKNLLKLCGIKPDEASSGEEAILLMRNNVYDIVFLDHMMPGMDGVETLEKLTEERLVPENTAVVALTANAVVGARERYLAAGFTDYLSKPMEIKHLVEKLKAYLPERAYSQEETDKPPAVSVPCGETWEAESAGDEGIMEFTPDAGGDVLEFTAYNEQETEGLSSERKKKTAYCLDGLKAAGIDAASGLYYCANDRALYFEILDDYVSSCEKKLTELDGFLDSEDWREYKVAVHALKSNARMIGIQDAFTQAKALEEAAEKKDAAFIRANHAALLKTVRDAAALIAGARDAGNAPTEAVSV